MRKIFNTCVISHKWNTAVKRSLFIPGVAGRCVTELQRMCCELWVTLLRKIQRGQKMLHVVQRFF